MKSSENYSLSLVEEESLIIRREQFKLLSDEF